MKLSTIEKFKKWCLENNATHHIHNLKADKEYKFPIFRLFTSECQFEGKYDNGYFNLGLCDFSEKPASGSTNGIEILKLYVDDYNEWCWYRDDDKTNYTVLLKTDLSKNGIKSIQNWILDHTNYTAFPNFNINDFIYLVKDFIYKVDESNTLKVESNYDSIDEFFDSDFESGDSIVIKAVNTDIILITIEKVIVNDEEVFKFLVDISTESNDEFKIKTTFDNQDKFKSLLEATINALKEYSEFYKYAEDLEKCL